MLPQSPLAANSLLEDVYAWVIANFGLAECGGGGGDPESSHWLKIKNPGTDAPTLFGQYSSVIFMFSWLQREILSKDGSQFQ
jgi:hypothetical protein